MSATYPAGLYDKTQDRKTWMIFFFCCRECIKYSSQSVIKFTMQKKLLEEMDINDCVKYIDNNEEFVKAWIQTCLIDCYRETWIFGEAGERDYSHNNEEHKDTFTVLSSGTHCPRNWSCPSPKPLQKYGWHQAVLSRHPDLPPQGVRRS
ncbi:unnamed protein product [Caretta caretta]